MLIFHCQYFIIIVIIIIIITFEILINFLFSFINSYTDGSSRVDHCAGLFYGGSGYQLGCNICFILTIISWCGCLSLIFHFIVDFILGMDCFEEKRKSRNTIDLGEKMQDDDFENQML